MNADYSQAVLKGLSTILSLPQVLEVAQCSSGELSLIGRAQSEFTDDQLDRIEHATGMTAGELALKAESNPDPKLEAMFEAWANWMRDGQSSALTGKRS